jgi:hypothetical protein
MSRLVDLIAEQNAVAFKEAIQEKIASKVIFALEQEKIAVAKAMLESKDEDDEDEDEMDDDEEDDDKEMKEELELMEATPSVRTLYNKYVKQHDQDGENSLIKARAIKKEIVKTHGSRVMSHLKKALNANLANDTEAEERHFRNAMNNTGKMVKKGN